ncbi:hypothetical protein RT717_25060 [Imperialibacter roseus]|uniref:Transglutaminase-like domain-containing protein n=1 Tax=Imperialibacter roseus TaxID=1324217 RepID=A0ABZ0IMV5_9BACT|nr:hypothetical protein [Imperialibacter roseus]WOK06349.1 hypothetical protein RT717_25060 [Imperialibacter roseus]
MINRIYILIFLTAKAFLGFGQEVNMSDLRFHSELEKAVLVNTSSQPTLSLLLVADESLDQERAKSALSTYQANLAFYQNQQSKYRSEEQFLKFFFYRVHRKELKSYEQYVSLASQFETGQYDCLTATSLYYLYLTDLGYKVNLVETDYHIYLKVNAGERSFLFESTDPIAGFISSEIEISEKEKEYLSAQRQNLSGISSNTTDGQKSYILNDKLTKRELAGLNYYNRAIAAWNAKDILKAVALVDKSYFLYPSDRISNVRDYFRGQSELLASK